MAAAVRKPAVSNKRKVSPTHADQHQPPKKKSPLFNQPQNFYAPQTIAAMTKEELSEWRKEQRRKRNRESAAASRNKTKARIEELEGEVMNWKRMYHDMEVKMRCMERHIQFLTKLNASSNVPQDGPQGTQGLQGLAPSPPPQAVVSHPNSPPLSPNSTHIMASVVPTPVTSSTIPPPPPYSASTANTTRTTNLFPRLLSEPKRYTPVEKLEVAKPTPVVATVAAQAVVTKSKESKEHVNSISRQAVKSGANFDSYDETTTIKQQQQQQGQAKQPPTLPTCTSTVVIKDGDGVQGMAVPSGDVVLQEEAPVQMVEGAFVDALASQASTQQDVVAAGVVAACPTLESSSPESSDDEDFLDLLADTLDGLDGEFDPELLI